MDVFANLQLTENWGLLWPFPGNFSKISAKNHCDCRQKTFKGETKLFLKRTSKRDGEATLIFWMSKSYQKGKLKQPWFLLYFKIISEKQVEVVPIFCPSKLYHKTTSKWSRLFDYWNYIKKARRYDQEICLYWRVSVILTLVWHVESVGIT